ncbi:MAG: AAA family ATPase [Syntrophobacterales bacterium]|nr:MAG: AAA family ATPase [Syntrophobacterales bacterium]
MKIAISGKGGVGKTTLAGVMARILAQRGKKVLAIDADPDANLASALGFPSEMVGKLNPLIAMTPLVEERTGAKKGTYGAMFKLNPKVDDIPDEFGLSYRGVKLLVLGAISQGGGGCFCPENVLLKSLMQHLFVGRDEVVIVDMEAGLEHLGRGSTESVDALIVVVEPGLRSIGTTKQIKKLATDLGVKRVLIVGNKITTEEDRKIIEEHLSDFNVLGHLSFNQKILQADRDGVSPYDIDDRVKAEVGEIIERLEAQ